MHVFCKVSCNFSKTVLSLQLVLSCRKTAPFKKREKERERDKKREIYRAYARARSFRETSYRMQPRYSYFRFPVSFLTKSACIARLYRAHVSCLFPLGDRVLLQAEMLSTDSRKESYFHETWGWKELCRYRGCNFRESVSLGIPGEEAANSPKSRARDKFYPRFVRNSSQKWNWLSKVYLGLSLYFFLSPVNFVESMPGELSTRETINISLSVIERQLHTVFCSRRCFSAQRLKTLPFPYRDSAKLSNGCGTCSRIFYERNRDDIYAYTSYVLYKSR